MASDRPSITPGGPPPVVAELVRRFGDHIDAYKSGRYNETQLRREFIDPLFRGLGWDVDNEQGYAEAYKDVIHEAAVRIEGAVKAPDYSFRIGGLRKFFLEAKKPSINIKGDPAPAYQLRRYAWSAKLPLSILTDFEEFAVYDCRIRPAKTDSPATARVLYLKYTDYLDRWSEIASVFSREAVLTGSFDKYVESKRKKRGTAEVDAAFLQEIEGWRETLARNIALRNATLTQRQLNFAVQVTVDRIIFLRMCEDRGIEDYARLMVLLNGDRVYDRLIGLFREADQRYNSGLFHFQRERGRADPDEITPGLTIDDRVLKDIIKGLYYPDSPYEFSVLPADILGHVYEQFLGKVIRLTSGHRAKVEEKPEVRKAGGVYYTPTYIVDYIVKHTVGRLLGQPLPAAPGSAGGSSSSDGTSQTDPPAKPGAQGSRHVKWITRDKGKAVNQPRLDKPLRVLDPACGSGSFLLGAYQYLLDWYLEYYTTHDPEKWARKRNPPIYLTSGTGVPPVANYRLTVAERKRILLEHIFGVDIDPQAVEVTKLSLLLKVLEGETAHSLGTHLWYEKERALPDLATNIKCGNSLIGPDFYDNQQTEMFDEDERLRINVFDWAKEFPQVFQPSRSRDLPGRGARGSSSRGYAGENSPGFDAVIGNPPYIRMEAFKELKDYLREHYAVHDERTDLYVYFIEREHELLRHGGRFGMIVSNKFLRANYGRKVRQLLADTATMQRIVDLAGLPVFRGATVRTIVLITSKDALKRPAMYSPPPEKETFVGLEARTNTLQYVADPIAYQVPQSSLTAEEWRLNRPEHAALFERLHTTGTSLVELMNGRICMGIKSGLTDAFVIRSATRDAIVAQNAEAEEIIRPFLQGRGIRRYHLHPSDEYLIYTYHGIDMSPYPAVIEHLRPFKKRLEGRATKQVWYELQQPQLAYKELLEQPKIVFPDIATSCRFALDTGGHFGANTVYFLPSDNLYLLGLLNSTPAHFFFAQTCAALEGPGQAYLRFFGQYLEGFPVPEIDSSDRAERSRHDRMVTLVQQMLDLHKQLAAAKTAHEKTAIQRQIDATDRRIDQLVYDLYGLTNEEIAIVEQATQP